MGHRYSDILEYTWPQFLGFSKACGRRRDANALELFSLMVTATHGDQDGVDAVFKRYTKDL